MQRANECGLVLELAADRFQRFLEKQSRGVRTRGVKPGHRLVLVHHRLHESLVIRRVARCAVPACRVDAEGFVAHVLQHAFVDAGRIAEHRDLRLHAEFAQRLEETQAVDASEPGIHAVHVGLDLGDVGAVIGHIERRPQLLHDFPAVVFVHVLETSLAFVAVGKIVGDRRHALQAQFLRGEFAEHVHRLRGGACRVQHVIVFLLLREVVLRGGCRRDQRHPRIADVLVDRERFKRRKRPDDHMHLVTLDQLLRFAFRQRRLAGGIGDEKLDLAPGKQVVALLEKQRDAFFHLLAARRERA